ncbi:hypothetical protein EI94DRAFT_1729187 [Lactarius quietus]|nr:hypothetical protein EI94DRAFT_1729187 [Lactarius quietus]
MCWTAGCAEEDREFWAQECHHPPTFQSWFMVMNLRLRMLMRTSKGLSTTSSSMSKTASSRSSNPNTSHREHPHPTQPHRNQRPRPISFYITTLDTDAQKRGSRRLKRLSRSR